MEAENPVRSRNEKLLFTAAAGNETLVGGLTLLRLVPSLFATTLRFVKNARGGETTTLVTAPADAREKMMSFWGDHLQMPMTDRLEFMIDDIAQLARMSGESEQARKLQLSFHSIDDKMAPFMPHAGLRLIYDTQPPQDPNWSLAQIDDARPRLGDLALYVDIVPVEVDSERPQHSAARRDIFLERLEHYKNRLAGRRYPGVGEISPTLQARVIDIDRSLLSIDVERDDEAEDLSPTMYAVDGEAFGAAEMADEIAQEEQHTKEHSEEHAQSHNTAHGVGGAGAAMHMSHDANDGPHGEHPGAHEGPPHAGDSHAAAVHADGGAHAEHEAGAQHAHGGHEEDAELESYILRAEGLHGLIHARGNMPLLPQELAEIGKLRAILGAKGQGALAFALSDLAAAHMAHVHMHHAVEEALAEQRRDIEKETREAVAENEKAAREQTDLTREKAQLLAEEAIEEALQAAEEAMHHIAHAGHAAHEAGAHLHEEAEEGIEELAEGSGEALSERARELLADILREAALLRGETAELALKLRERAADSDLERQNQMHERMHEGLVEQNELSLDRNRETLDENRKEQIEAEAKLREDIEQTQEQAAQGREANEKMVRRAEKEKERVDQVNENRVSESEPHEEEEQEESHHAHGPEEEGPHHGGHAAHEPDADEEDKNDEESPAEEQMRHHMFEHAFENAAVAHGAAVALGPSHMSIPIGARRYAGMYDELQKAGTAAAIGLGPAARPPGFVARNLSPAQMAALGAAPQMDTGDTFTHAANIQTNPMGQWAPLGKTQFAHANFRMPPDAAFTSPGAFAASLWAHARQPDADPVAHMTRIILDNHAASPRKDATLRAPNFGHSFADMYHPAPLPAPAPGMSEDL